MGKLNTSSTYRFFNHLADAVINFQVMPRDTGRNLFYQTYEDPMQVAARVDRNPYGHDLADKIRSGEVKLK